MTIQARVERGWIGHFDGRDRVGANDPKIGSYINQDPIGLNGGMNHYQYASNPISSVDPLGLVGKGAVGVIEGPKISLEVNNKA
jgi:uncharacterized protein RhaS with RHS repeats